MLGADGLVHVVVKAQVDPREVFLNVGDAYVTALGISRWIRYERFEHEDACIFEVRGNSGENT